MNAREVDFLDGELGAVVEHLRRTAEAGTPLLPAPEDRMARVCRKVRRARRVRAVALSAPVVALAVTVGALLSGGSASTVPAADGPSAPSSTPLSSPQPRWPAGTATQSLHLSGTAAELVATAPVGWRTLPPPGARTAGLGAYVVSASAAAGNGPCQGALDGSDEQRCLPVTGLSKGGVLVFWQYDELAPTRTASPNGPRLLDPSRPCRAIGGTRAIEARFPHLFKDNTVVRAYACLASPDQEQVDETAAVLSSTHLAGAGD
ncbi:hypothetical protein [Streptomyces violascens]|uniref:hypothetical protein n=1 Tax=Streptomyces violascens TaxID=67381 RepID=UPI003676CBCF